MVLPVREDRQSKELPLSGGKQRFVPTECRRYDTSGSNRNSGSPRAVPTREKRRSMLDRKDFRIILAIVAISFLQGLQYGVSPVLGKIAEHYPDVNVSLVQMLITAPGILAIAVALIGGWLVTKASMKKLLLVSAAIAGITGFIPLLADSFLLLFVSRVAYGVALGLATALNAAVVADFFEGEKRVLAMGIQSASVGAGLMVVQSVSGFLGRSSFRTSYLVNVIGFLSLAILIIFLPDRGKVKISGLESIQLNRSVFAIAIFEFLENFFLITFTTNIAMHLSGSLRGSTGASGLITGVFSASQILIGLLLGAITKKTKNMTMAAAMFLFSLGAVILVLFPGTIGMLMAGALLCGFSQGIFIPTSYVNVANCVSAASVTMASAVLTTAQCLGQLVSPVMINAAAKSVLGSVTTRNVYILAAAGMAVSAAACAVWKKTER